MKVCVICKKEKPQEDFYFRKDSKKYRSDCKDCFYETQSRWRRNNLDKVRIRNKRWRDNNLEASRKHGRESAYKQRYGITIDQKRQMWHDQKGKCFACGKEIFSIRQSNVDHNHVTGKIRALLCTRCNTALAYVENKELLQKLLDYLKKFS